MPLRSLSARFGGRRRPCDDAEHDHDARQDSRAAPEAGCEAGANWCPLVGVCGGEALWWVFVDEYLVAVAGEDGEVAFLLAVDAEKEVGVNTLPAGQSEVDARAAIDVGVGVECAGGLQYALFDGGKVGDVIVGPWASYIDEGSASR